MPGRSKDCLVILAIAVCGFSPPSAAEIHKCTSKDGKVSFSDVACPHDAVGETLNIPANPASSAPAQRSDLGPNPTVQPPATRLDRQRTREPNKEQPPRTNTSLIYQKWLIEERNATIRGAIPPEINRPREQTRTVISRD